MAATKHLAWGPKTTSCIQKFCRRRSTARRQGDARAFKRSLPRLLGWQAGGASPGVRPPWEQSSAPPRSCSSAGRWGEARRQTRAPGGPSTAGTAPAGRRRRHSPPISPLCVQLGRGLLAAARPPHSQVWLLAAPGIQQAKPHAFLKPGAGPRLCPSRPPLAHPAQQPPTHLHAGHEGNRVVSLQLDGLGQGVKEGGPAGACTIIRRQASRRRQMAAAGAHRGRQRLWRRATGPLLASRSSSPQPPRAITLLLTPHTHHPLCRTQLPRTRLVLGLRGEERQAAAAAHKGARALLLQQAAAAADRRRDVGTGRDEGTQPGWC